MTQTLTTTDELKHLASSDNTNELTRSLARECLANREAQPVAIVESSAYVTAAQIIGDEPPMKAVKELYEGALVIGQHIYTTPPAPAVVNGRTAEGWMAEALLQKKTADDFRAAMLAQPVSSGYKLPDGWRLVPIKATPEILQAGIKAHYERLLYQQPEDAKFVGPMESAYNAMLAAAPEGSNG